MTKFEVGKKYKSEFGCIVECVHVSEGPQVVYVTMVFADGSVDTRTDQFWSGFKKYKPPVEHVRYVHFIRVGDERVGTLTRENPEPPPLYKVLKTIKVIYTENLDETT